MFRPLQTFEFALEDIHSDVLFLLVIPRVNQTSFDSPALR